MDPSKLLDEILNPKEEEDYYAVLGCDRTNNKDQITTEYKKRALQLHPDRNSNTNANALFLKLTQAYEVLSNDELRREYDTWKQSGIPKH